MRQNFKRRLRTRSSKQTCEEKFCCPFIDTEAKYYCQDCKTAQCQACESSLHKTKVKYDFHCRKPIAVVSESSLCQAKKVNLVCQERNYPDLWCEQCQVGLCFTCYDTYHASDKRRQHINVSIAHHLKKQQKEKQEQAEIQLFDSSEFYQDAVTDINPQTPFSLATENNSVTFFSFPQELNSEDDLQFASVTTSFHEDHNNTTSPELSQGAAACSDLPAQVDHESVAAAQEQPNSFLLIDHQGALKVMTKDDFIDKLGCDRNDTFKVVSVFGSSANRKLHTINHMFFRGLDVFKTSTCITGVCCSADKQHKLIVMDTKGLLDSVAQKNNNKQLLLKVLAVSDVVIYHTRDEHLPGDMVGCLHDISKAYLQHFQQELQSASKQFGISESDMGPSLVVFHETANTDALDNTGVLTEGTLREMIKPNCPLEAFSKICYVGTKTITSPEELGQLEHSVIAETEDMSVRASRRPEVIFRSLKALDEKFSQKMETLHPDIFTDHHFSCRSRCLACKAGCILSVNHHSSTESHDAGRDRQCEYQSGYGNKVFLCKMCMRKNKRVVVVPKTSSSSDTAWMGLTKYIWSGYVYECENCGVIHRSREHWYGNEDEEKVLQVECRHIWPQGPIAFDGTHNAARKVLEGFHYVADTVSSVGAGPAKYLAEWTADKINPSYWMPNSEIIKCSKCQMFFDSTEQKHHCRACGKGFCADCSSKKRPVPERGWGSEPVRVCDACYANPDTGTDVESVSETDSGVAVEPADLTARRVGEAVSSTFSAVVSALDYSIGMIKNSAKPAYWVPDEETTECCVCQNKFGPRLPIHHCRACGQGVCKNCSPNKRSVPLRGWDYPVRVCLNCEQKELKI
ncbi:unnamed protein product [Candidula unifasciata]|uniref:Zinc finger FYVE domain-containing protein 1 n=1 Tax=Candidula unifasciata TaxID=100452 RepID=A0A8S3ZBA5_9EUPU|nr:unnamed protein product [Candidula unifasciata]